MARLMTLASASVFSTYGRMQRSRCGRREGGDEGTGAEGGVWKRVGEGEGEEDLEEEGGGGEEEGVGVGDELCLCIVCRDEGALFRR